jgi:hypothetical protein
MHRVAKNNIDSLLDYEKRLDKRLEEIKELRERLRSKFKKVK